MNEKSTKATARHMESILTTWQERFEKSESILLKPGLENFEHYFTSV